MTRFGTSEPKLSAYGCQPMKVQGFCSVGIAETTAPPSLPQRATSAKRHYCMLDGLHLTWRNVGISPDLILTATSAAQFTPSSGVFRISLHCQEPLAACL